MAFQVSKSSHNSRTKHYFANPRIKIQENMTRSLYRNSYLHFIDSWAAVAVYTDRQTDTHAHTHTLPYTSLRMRNLGIIIPWDLYMYVTTGKEVDQSNCPELRWDWDYLCKVWRSRCVCVYWFANVIHFQNVVQANSIHKVNSSAFNSSLVYLHCYQKINGKYAIQGKSTLSM